MRLIAEGGIYHRPTIITILTTTIIIQQAVGLL